MLAAFRDRVLFVKHNLNARAIASRKTERAKIQADNATPDSRQKLGVSMRLAYAGITTGIRPVGRHAIA